MVLRALLELVELVELLVHNEILALLEQLVQPEQLEPLEQKHPIIRLLRIRLSQLIMQLHPTLLMVIILLRIIMAMHM